MPKTQKQEAEERAATTAAANAPKESTPTTGEQIAHRSSVSRAASMLPGMPGPKPGGLAESLADPARLQQSLEDSRRRQQDYEDAKSRAGVTDARRPGNTPPNKFDFARGGTAKTGSMISVNRNPRFERQQAAPEPSINPVVQKKK